MNQKITQNSIKQQSKILFLYIFEQNQSFIQISQQLMQKVVIQAEFVSIHCYIGTKNFLYETLSLIQSESPEQNSNVKIVFLVYNLDLKQYTRIYQNLKQSFAQQFRQYFINILMVKDLQDAKEHLSHIRKVNQPEFEYNYLKLQQHSQQVIRLQIMQSYISSKFKWNKVKAKYFMQKNNITSMEELLEYSGFPFFERSIITKTKNFKQFCQNSNPQ